MNYLESVNSPIFYAIVAFVLTFITIMCFVFLIKSYKTGVKIGMDPKVLKKTITASATFTLLPSISILLGVIALSGTLGVPLSWLRLSVIGSLQYELNVAEIAAQSIGLSGLNLNEINNVYSDIAWDYIDNYYRKEKKGKKIDVYIYTKVIEDTVFEGNVPLYEKPICVIAKPK